MADTPDYYNKEFMGVKIDVYRVLEMFGITSPPLQHAIKKLLRAGESTKSKKEDIKGAIVALERWLEMKEEETDETFEIKETGLDDLRKKINLKNKVKEQLKKLAKDREHEKSLFTALEVCGVSTVAQKCGSKDPEDIAECIHGSVLEGDYETWLDNLPDNLEPIKVGKDTQRESYTGDNEPAEITESWDDPKGITHLKIKLNPLSDNYEEAKRRKFLYLREQLFSPLYVKGVNVSKFLDEVRIKINKDQTHLSGPDLLKVYRYFFNNLDVVRSKVESGSGKERQMVNWIIEAYKRGKLNIGD